MIGIKVAGCQYGGGGRYINMTKHFYSNCEKVKVKKYRPAMKLRTINIPEGYIDGYEWVWKEGYKKHVCNFLEIDHSVDYDSDYIHESVKSDKEEFTNYINNLFNDTNHILVGKCPECGLMLTNEDELEDGTHECPKCGSILENKLDFWEIED